MTAVLERLDITEEGIFPDLDEATYHAQRASLSSSGARKLLDCPARFRYQQDHGAPMKREFEFGKAAHLKLLGRGAQLALIDADNYRTKAAQEARDTAYAAGRIPMLVVEEPRVDAMVARVRAHPYAGSLFDPELGIPEPSLFYRDPVTGIMLRARPDHLDDDPAGRLILPDYKTAQAADEDSITRALHHNGYACQGAWFGDICKGLLICDEYVFILVVQEKEPPFLVNVVTVSQMALTIGRHRNRQAIDLYARCVAEGRWPGYEGFDHEIATVSLPGWVERDYFEEIQ